jgi:hypothetical protein
MGYFASDDSERVRIGFADQHFPPFLPTLRVELSFHPLAKDSGKVGPLGVGVIAKDDRLARRDGREDFVLHRVQYTRFGDEKRVKRT